mmetsp:Transcript_30130/g.75499  ORF Transcript_30130/g.75499 Transcript_30130/m.75499 type:complete len:217 (-) Transcript_30130:91-741(-)
MPPASDLSPFSSANTPWLIHTSTFRRNTVLEIPISWASSSNPQRVFVWKCISTVASIGLTLSSSVSSPWTTSTRTVPSVGFQFICRGALRWWYRRPYASIMPCIAGGKTKSGASLDMGGQNSALTMVASSGDSPSAVADCVPGTSGLGAALTLPLMRLLSLTSLSITSHLCRLDSPKRSLSSSSVCVSRSTSYPTLVSRRSASMFRYSLMSSSLLP